MEDEPSAMRPDLQPATRMMGHGYDPARLEGAVKPPIFLTSTYAFPNAAAGKRHFQALAGKSDPLGNDAPGNPASLVYARFNGPNQRILEERLAVFEGAEAALGFSSGMSAITTLLMSFCRPGDVVVHSGPLYAAVETVLHQILGEFGVRFLDFPAAASPAEIADALARAKTMGRVALIYLESPANPTNVLVDVEAVAQARDAAFPEAPPPIAIDNTFLGPVFQKPLRHGADLVLYSLTKYVGGHSDLVAGAVVGPARLLTPVRMQRNMFGTIVDAHTAWMLLRSLETVDLRMRRSAENAARICRFLRAHPKVERVGYPGDLADDPGPQGDIYRRHCTGGGSTFSLYLKGGEREAFGFLDSLRIARLAVSLGGNETLASAPAAMTHLSVPEARRAQLGIADNLVRISVGIEDADDLIADMAQALERI